MIVLSVIPVGVFEDLLTGLSVPDGKLRGASVLSFGLSCHCRYFFYT
jgi:hypothetical protein